MKFGRNRWPSSFYIFLIENHIWDFKNWTQKIIRTQLRTNQIKLNIKHIVVLPIV